MLQQTAGLPPSFVKNHQSAKIPITSSGNLCPHYSSQHNICRGHSVSSQFNILPEGDCELCLVIGTVTHRHHPGVPLADPARVVLLLAHVVDNVLLTLLPPPRPPIVVGWADDVELIVLPGQVACTKLC